MEKKDEIKKTKKITPIKINFSNYNNESIYYISNKTSVKSSFIPKEFTSGEGIVDIIDKIFNIKFNNMNTLIDFCKESSKPDLLIVFQWINFLIFKDDFKYLFELNMNTTNKQIFGFYNIIETILNEKEDFIISFGIKHYSSEFRTNIIKSIIILLNNTEFLTDKDEFQILLRKFSLNIINLNFEEANKNIKEGHNFKDVFSNIYLNFSKK